MYADFTRSFVRLDKKKAFLCKHELLRIGSYSCPVRPVGSVGIGYEVCWCSTQKWDETTFLCPKFLSYENHAETGIPKIWQ